MLDVLFLVGDDAQPLQLGQDMGPVRGIDPVDARGGVHGPLGAAAGKDRLGGPDDLTSFVEFLQANPGLTAPSSRVRGL